MPDNIQISPPPYHDPDTNSQTWRNWFSQLRDQVNGVERVTTGGGSGGGGGSTTPDVDHTITTVRAQTQINAGQCVYVTGDNYVSRCSSDDLATRDVFGIALENATAGEEVEVATCGDATIPFASYTPGTVLYVGSDGYLTTTPPTTGYTKIVGTALRSNVVGMHWEPSIKLFTATPDSIPEDYALWVAFSEGTGTSVADSAGTLTGGTLTGSGLWDTGIRNSALTADGTNYLQFSAASNPANFTDEYTVGYWIYPTAGASVFAFDYGWRSDQTVAGNNKGIYVGCSWDGSTLCPIHTLEQGMIGGYNGQNRGRWRADTLDLALNEWNLVFHTRTLTGGISYVYNTTDGTRSESFSTSLTTLSLFDSRTTNVLALSAADTDAILLINSAGQTIDELFGYTRVLTTDEMDIIWNSGAGRSAED